jgi:hypothetical protein
VYTSVVGEVSLRKIIVIEGLIILGIAMLYVDLQFLNYREQTKKLQLEQTGEVVGICDRLDTNKTRWLGEDLVYMPTGTYVMIHGLESFNETNHTLKKDFPNINNPVACKVDKQKKTVTVQRYYDSDGKQVKFIDYSKLSLIPILLYLVYLIVRLVFWGIKPFRKYFSEQPTLKNKHNEC